MASLTVFVVLLLLPLAASLPTASGPTAVIDSGPITGLTTQVPSAPDVTVDKFLGIPYAAAPIRFSPPQPPVYWTAPLDAISFGPVCIQQFSYPEASRNFTMSFFNTPAPVESEDCLSLNVFAPAATSSSSQHGGCDGADNGKAVMVWIYGGSLKYGGSQTAYYDGSFLAASSDVIIVTINYRTNIFGFPGAAILPPGTQNLGYLDQRFALEWVQRNIAAFGGDPAKVTVFGESAGSQSVDALITQPPDPLTFRAAIMESGTASIRSPQADYSAGWNNASQALGCSADDLACMRAVPATTMKDKIERLGLNFSPVPDNITYTTYPRTQRRTSTFLDHKIARVPILVGSNADEGRLFAVGSSSLSAFLTSSLPASTPAELFSLLNTTYAATSPDAFVQVANFITDSNFLCPSSLVARETAQVAIPAHRYFYNASFPNMQLFRGSGVYHASEIPIVFGTYPTEGATRWQKEVAKGVMKIWADFAKDPEGFDAWWATPSVGILGGGVRAEEGMEGKGDGSVVRVVDASEVDERCKIWDLIYDARSGGK